MVIKKVDHGTRVRTYIYGVATAEIKLPGIRKYIDFCARVLSLLHSCSFEIMRVFRSTSSRQHISTFSLVVIQYHIRARDRVVTIWREPFLQELYHLEHIHKLACQITSKNT
jgi:hypothetical protein